MYRMTLIFKLVGVLVRLALRDGVVTVFGVLFAWFIVLGMFITLVSAFALLSWQYVDNMKFVSLHTLQMP